MAENLRLGFSWMFDYANADSHRYNSHCQLRYWNHEESYQFSTEVESHVRIDCAIATAAATEHTHPLEPGRLGVRGVRGGSRFQLSEFLHFLLLLQLPHIGSWASLFCFHLRLIGCQLRSSFNSQCVLPFEGNPSQLLGISCESRVDTNRPTN